MYPTGSYIVTKILGESLRCEFYIALYYVLSEKAIKILSTVQGAVDSMMQQLLSPPLQKSKSSRGESPKGIRPSCECCSDRAVSRGHRCHGEEQGGGRGVGRTLQGS